MLPMSDKSYWYRTAGWYKVMEMQIEAALHVANFNIMKNVPKIMKTKPSFLWQK